MFEYHVKIFTVIVWAIGGTREVAITKLWNKFSIYPKRQLGLRRRHITQNAHYIVLHSITLFIKSLIMK